MPITLNSVIQILVFVIIVALITKPLGLYMTNVFNGERNWLTPVVAPIEKFFYRISGVNADEEQACLQSTMAMRIFSAIGLLFTYMVLKTHQWQDPFLIPRTLAIWRADW